MGAPERIRDDLPAEELRRLARLERDGRVACRLLALANAVDGMSREQAERQAGMNRLILRDWVIRFNAEGVAGLRDRPKSGRPPWLDEGQLATLKGSMTTRWLGLSLLNWTIGYGLGLLWWVVAITGIGTLVLIHSGQGPAGTGAKAVDSLDQLLPIVEFEKY